MPIPILLMQPETISDTTANGGRMVNTEVVQSAGGAGQFSLFNKAEQLAGATKLRKFFLKLADATNPTALKAIVYLKAPSTRTNSKQALIAGTQRDTAATIGTRRYATGTLAANATTGATVLTVNFDTGHGADNVVQAGDTLIVDIDGTSEDYNLTVASVVWTGDQAAITVTTGILADLTSGMLVGSCVVDTTNINPSFSVTKSFIGSTYNETTYPILLENLATIEETVTITFTSSTVFSVVSDKRGVLATGSVSADYVSTNTQYSLPYFTLQAAGWGGTHTAGESMQIVVHPAAVPLWVEYEASAGAGTGVKADAVGVQIEH